MFVASKDVVEAPEGTPAQGPVAAQRVAAVEQSPESEVSPRPVRQKPRLLLAGAFALLLFGFVAASGACAYEVWQSRRLEARLDANERSLAEALRKLSAMNSAAVDDDSLADDIEHLDDVLASVASDGKRQGAMVLIPKPSRN